MSEVQSAKPEQRWDIFCAVVDNFGDIGVCWRLARQMANEHGVDVRLWVDNLLSFSRLCPSISPDVAVQHIGLIEVRHWSPIFPVVEAADVVIEAFACELPESYLDAMSRCTTHSVWINLEYLSAENWIEECHGLTSPQSRVPVTKYFFFPGFTPKTGGLLRERDLLDQRAAFGEEAIELFWQRLGEQFGSLSFANLFTSGSHVGSEMRKIDSELRVSIFCYENGFLPDLLEYWSNGNTSILLFVAAGMTTEQVSKWLEFEIHPGEQFRRGALTINALPFLSHADFDRVLWGCDVNFVRGEDSFVRAQWAQRPFVWQIYPQSEDAHLVKLDAFLDRYLAGFPDADPIRRFWQAWNGHGQIVEAWKDFVFIRRLIELHGKVWVSELDRAGNLADNLVRFVSGK